MLSRKQKGYIVMVLFMLIPLSMNAQTYAEKYPSECKEALDYYKANKTAFEKAASGLGVSPEFLFAIISPELSQFSYISNVAETGALKYLYVQGGKSYANFSIGYFQMKPSFIEQMEESLQKNEKLKREYAACLIDDPDSRKARVERVKRLDSEEWQFAYLSLFCALVKERFPTKKFSSEADAVKFYASAYNTGFDKSETTIESFSQKAMFPHFGKTKYNYSAVALWFYKEAKKKTKK